MDTMTAFAMGEDNRGRERMVFDYEETVDCWVWENATSYNESTKFPEHLIKKLTGV